MRILDLARLVCCSGLFLSLILSPNAVAQTAPPGKLPAEMFFRAPAVEEAVLSPSGTMLALTTAKGGQRTGLFVFNLAAGGKVNRVAQFIDADVRDVKWLDETRLLYTAVDFSEGSGQRDSAPGLFIVNVDGTNKRELVMRKRYLVVEAGSKSTALEYNHNLLRVLPAKAGEANDKILIGKIIFGGRDALTTVQPMWLNVETGKTSSANFHAPENVTAWHFDSQGEARLVQTLNGTVVAYHWRGPGETAWKKIAEGSLQGMSFTPHTVDDAGNLYVTQEIGKAATSVLTRFDFATQAPSKEPLVSTPGFDFAGTLMLERGTGMAQGVRLTTDAETTIWFDEVMKRLQTQVDAALPGQINRISCRRCSGAEAVVLVRSFSDQNPGRLLLYRPTPGTGQQAWQSISPVVEGIDPKAMAQVSFQRIKARDGRDLPVWVTLPANSVAGKPAPAVVMVHGGPWVRGGHWSWNPTNQFLASRGYVVIEPEFRGSAGYGGAHYKAGWKQWGQAMQDDVADALLWAQAQKIASDKACIAGASYGGYSTLMGLVRHPSLYRCGAAWVAVTDLHLLVKGSWWVDDDTSNFSRKNTLPDMVGDVEKDASMLSNNSPILLADQIKAPLLLAFGEADMRVPLAHGNRMREALQKSNKDVEWVSYPGEGHSWSKRSTKLDFAQRLEQFLAKNLQPDGR